MLRVGLTGGIGSGKSRVCGLFAELGIPVIDSDQVARELVLPGSPALQQIVTLFGDGVLQADGSLNRAYMRELVFADREKRRQLEALLHPLIRKEIEQQLQRINAPYAILAIPLLLEKGWQQQLDRVLVIDCSEAQQLERALQRDGGTSEAIQQIIDSQLSRKERLSGADDIIDNSGMLADLRPQVEALHKYYLQLAANN